ncbi:MAG: insulinase family protein, partial [Alistipes sp.]
MKKLLMVIATAFMLSNAQAQLNPMEPIPADKAIRKGQLENGMTYYIRHNEKPKGQADFYIHYDVGAIQESDAQQGLAHFLEHMAFNGTKNLPGKQMMTYLEKIGVKFGANLNAGTSWDQTQYMMTDVPTTRQGIIDSAMLVLHDWSHFISILPEEVESERGVIKEELRTRDDANWRSVVKLLKALGKGTKYEHRNLIGSMDGLSTFPRQELVDFYEMWYRPNYQAIVIVGDVDVDKTEIALKKLMSDIPAPAANAPAKEVIVVPDNVEPIISIFTDKEMTNTSASIYIKRPELPNEANGLVYREMVDIMLNYITAMQNERFAEIAQKPNAPFLSAGMFDGSIGIIPTMVTTGFSVNTEDGKMLTGFEATLTEMEKTRRYGFTDGEFERAQNDLMRICERQYANRNDRMNSDFSERMFANYKQNKPMPSAEYEWKLDSTLVKMVSIADINQLCAQLIQPKNWVVTLTAPEKEGLVNPTEEQLLALIAKVQGSEIAAYEDNSIKEPLIADTKALKGSAVKATAANTVLGTTEWTLKNGAKIIVKPTTFKADEVILNVQAKGGLSILPNELYFTGKLMPGIMQQSGLGKFSATDLRKQLSGKSAAVGLLIDGYRHGMDGYGSPKDMETLMQLLYLNFTAPRFNEDDFNTYIKQVNAQVENMMKNPDYIVQSTLMETVYDNNYRSQRLSPALLKDIKFEELKAIHDKLFIGANNFTFTFVGNVDLNTLKPLVEKYIGSLPTSKTTLNYVDDHMDAVKGKVEKNIAVAMQQPKVSVWYYLTGDAPYTIENRLKMSFLSQALSSRYLISIREEKGGTYGVNAQGWSTFIPKQNYTLLIQFDTNEVQAEELSEIID